MGNLKLKDLKLSSKKLYKNKQDKIVASITVENCSDIDAKETIQLYIQDLYASVVRPIKELKAFKKVLIKAREKKKIDFEITENMLKFWNKDLKYDSEKGEFKIYIGSNSMDCLVEKIELI